MIRKSVMFEFHGWANIRVSDPEGQEPPVIDRGDHFKAIEKVRAAINDFRDEFSIFDVQRSSNGMAVLIAHGLRNHRLDGVLELFRRVARELPDSYGLLYVYDDEVTKHSNEFRVWRLALGRFEELPDPFLSPYIPTVERPYQDS